MNAVEFAELFPDHFNSVASLVISFFPNDLKFYDASLLDFEARTLPVISLFSGVGGLELGLCGQGPHLIIDLFQCLADVLWHLLEPLNSSSLLQLKLEWLTLRQVHPVCYARSSFCQRIFFLSALSQYFFDPAGYVLRLVLKLFRGRVERMVQASITVQDEGRLHPTGPHPQRHQQLRSQWVWRVRWDSGRISLPSVLAEVVGFRELFQIICSLTF